MKEEEIHEYIELIKDKELPKCPQFVEANVMRRLRTEDKESFGVWLNSFIPKNGFIAASLAMIVLTSSAISFASTIKFENESVRHQETIGALGFNHFHSKDILNLK